MATQPSDSSSRAVKNYRMHEGDVSIPAAWQDQSMQMFRISGPPSSNDASFIVTRDYNAGSLEPTAYAQAQQATLKQRFVDFRLVTQTENVVSGTRAAVLDYLWTANGITLRQRQAHVPASECMVILTMTARQADFEQHESAWLEVLQSLRLRDGTGWDEGKR